jgi:hypothetical protein
MGVIVPEIFRGPQFLGRLNDLIHALGADHEGIVKGKPDKQDGKNQKAMNGNLVAIQLSFFPGGRRG